MIKRLERGRDFAVSSSESRTVGGRRQERDESTEAKHPLAELSGGGAGFLPSPPLHGDSGTGKIGRAEQPGEPTRGRWMSR